MFEAPSTETVLEAIDALEAAHGKAWGPGPKLVPWSQLAFHLFPRGSGAWKRPVDQPHGRDQSPAVVFMNDLARNPAIRHVYSSRQDYYGRKAAK